MRALVMGGNRYIVRDTFEYDFSADDALLAELAAAR